MFAYATQGGHNRNPIAHFNQNDNAEI